MFRTDVATASASLPTPGAPGTPGYFTNGNPGTGVPATVVDADWANRVQEELVAIVLAAGISLNKTVNTQVRDAIAALYGGMRSAGQVTLTGSTSLTLATHIGKLMLINAAGATTQTLPAASAVPAGRRIGFLNIAAGTAAVSRAGADNIVVSSISLTSLSVGTGDTLVLESNGSNAWYAVGGSVQQVYAKAYLSQAVAKSASGTAVDFTGIPAWAKRITVMLDGVSGSGTANFQLQIGSGAFDNTGYTSAAMSATNAASTSTSGSTTGLLIGDNTAATEVLSGLITLVKISGNTWVMSGALATQQPANELKLSSGRKDLAGVLDRVRLTTTNGTDTFDAGSVNVMWE